MKELKVKFPGPDAPGYLKRARGLAAFGKLQNSPASCTPAEVDEAVDWLVSIVVEPKDRKKARQIILDLSVDELTQVFEQLQAGPDPN